jgi:hypothetical protein
LGWTRSLWLGSQGNNAVIIIHGHPLAPALFGHGAGKRGSEEAISIEDRRRRIPEMWKGSVRSVPHFYHVLIHTPYRCPCDGVGA